MSIKHQPETSAPVNNLVDNIKLLQQVESALTPQQYARMKDKAMEKIGIMKLTNMNVEDLKRELPNIVRGDPEADKIMESLATVFPGIVSEVPISESQKAPKPNTGPLNWFQGKWNNFTSWIIPDSVKKAYETSKSSSSGAGFISTLLFGASMPATLDTGYKLMSGLNSLKNNPSAGLDELSSLFSGENVEKIWGEIQKNPDVLSERFGVPKSDVATANTVFESILSKKVS